MLGALFSQLIPFPSGNALYIEIGVAAIVGIIAEFIIGWRLPLGIIGAIIVAFIGAWLLTDVITQVNIPGTMTLFGVPNVPIVKELVGAAVLVILWHLVTFGAWRRRRSYYRR